MSSMTADSSTTTATSARPAATSLRPSAAFCSTSAPSPRSRCPASTGTGSVTLVTSANDKALRALHDPGGLGNGTVRSLPLVAHWLDGEPIDGGITAMAGIEDRHRNLMVYGTPVATGVVAAGDAWGCSNPSVGRGASIGMLHATVLRDTIATTSLDDPWGVRVQLPRGHRRGRRALVPRGHAGGRPASPGRDRRAPRGP